MQHNIYVQTDFDCQEIAEAVTAAQRFNKLYAITVTGVFVPGMNLELTRSKVLER